VNDVLLELNAITKAFGGLLAVDGLSATIEQGAIHGLIGPNGSGKTTVFNLISGFYKLTSGLVKFEGKSITGLKPNVIVSKGIARTFQNTRLFPLMTVQENLFVGANCTLKSGTVASIIGLRSVKEEERRLRDRTDEIMDYLEISQYKDRLASDISYGISRLVEIGRAMSTGCKIIMLDEPAAGLNEQEKNVLMSTIRKIRENGYTVLVVEHDMRLIMGICDRISVLNFGKKIAEGSAEEVGMNQDVIEAYLGRRGAHAKN